MRTILVALILSLVFAGCASGPSAHSEKPVAAQWSPLPFPEAPPPIAVKDHFGLPPPRYPYAEKRDGIYGEVLLEGVVDETQHLASWEVVRTTTEGYANAVLATLSKEGKAPGVPAGVYLYSVVFNGDGQGFDASRPATFWVGTDNFGSHGSIAERPMGPSGPLSDRAIRAKLLGTWIVAFKQAGASMDGTVTFSADGRLVGEAVFSRGSARMTVTFKAEWRIEDAALIETITAASDATMIGLQTRDRIILIDDDRYVARNERGVVETLVRKKDQQR